MGLIAPQKQKNRERLGFTSDPLGELTTFPQTPQSAQDRQVQPSQYFPQLSTHFL